MSGFDELSPALQYQIVNTLGFSSLRAVQEQSVGPIVAGDNCVILAPTAGGKTEASMFPLLSQMDREDWKPVSVIYVAPIRALLNNQEHRLQQYAGMLGRRAFKWHGDVSPSQKKGFVGDPADMLLTTPESLEVMLMSKKVPAERLFRHLRAVVIDEIHAFVGDDRGAHLSAVLERLSRFCGRDVQRIGLSATVGNPADILSWVAGSSKRPGRVVDPGGENVTPKLALDWVGNDANAAKMIAQLHPGKKRLVFVDSRRRVEALGRELMKYTSNVHVTHSSLSVEERRDAEIAFEEGKDCVIVATSALELGIDIGDLDHVLQIDAPTTVAAFLQRMGRTGRRAENPISNCTFLCTDEELLVQAAALLRLRALGYIEPVPLRRKCVHMLAHQLLALCIQEEGVPVSDWWAWVARATPFQELTEDDRSELVEHMLAEDILVQVGGRYTLGDRGEKLYGWRNFSDLYAVFSTPQTLTVMWGGQEIGQIDALFAEQEKLETLSFVLGAKSWRAVNIDWKEGVVRVEPMADSNLPRWQGRGQLLGRTLCQAMREVLTDDVEDADWSKRAREQMKSVRAEFTFLSADGLDLVPCSTGFNLWTFAGGRANNLLAKLLEAELGPKVTTDNRYVGFRADAAQSVVAIREAIARLQAEGRPTHDDAVRFAESCASQRLSKFQACLSDRLESEYLAEMLTDPAVVRTIIAETIRVHDDDWAH